MSNVSFKADARFGNPVWVVGKTVIIFVLSQLVGGFLAGAALIADGNSDSVKALDKNPGAEFLFIVLVEALTVLLVALFLQRRGWFFSKLRGLSLKNIGWGRRPHLSDIWATLIGFLVFYSFLIVISVILSAIFPDLNKGSQDVGFNNLQGSIEKILAFVGLVFLPPLGEETLVRGYLYTGLRQRLRFWPAVLITSILFGAAHLETGTTAALLWAAGVNTFILSVVLCYLREKTNALYAGMMLHALNNAIAFGFHFHALMF